MLKTIFYDHNTIKSIAQSLKDQEMHQTYEECSQKHYLIEKNGKPNFFLLYSR